MHFFKLFLFNPANFSPNALHNLNFLTFFGASLKLSALELLIVFYIVKPGNYFKHKYSAGHSVN